MREFLWMWLIKHWRNKENWILASWYYAANYSQLVGFYCAEKLFHIRMMKCSTLLKNGALLTTRRSSFQFPISTSVLYFCSILQPGKFHFASACSSILVLEVLEKAIRSVMRTICFVSMKMCRHGRIVARLHFRWPFCLLLRCLVPGLRQQRGQNGGSCEHCARILFILVKKQVENASRRYYKWKRKFSSCSHSWWVFKRLNWCSWKFDKVHLTDERLTVKHFYHYFPDDVNRNGKPLLCCFVKSLLER